jgi:hypothetical protein
MNAEAVIGATAEFTDHEPGTVMLKPTPHRTNPCAFAAQRTCAKSMPTIRVSPVMGLPQMAHVSFGRM